MQTRLPFFGVVRVSGEDRASFLHGQLSNDINHLNENSACYATYNTPKGRVLANMIVLNRGEDLLLIMAQIDRSHCQTVAHVCPESQSHL